MNRYTRTAITLHWLIAALILCALALGLYMHELPFSPLRLKLYSYHKWLGVTIAALVAVRLVWRFGHPPPPLPDSVPRPQQLAASAVHLALYLLMVAIPLSGWVMSSAKGFQTVWFGVLPLPDLVAKDKVLGEQLAQLHEALNYALIALLCGHIGAALKHHLIDRDDILLRMLQLLRRSSAAKTPPRQS